MSDGITDMMREEERKQLTNDCDCMKNVPEMIKGKIAEMNKQTKGFNLIESDFESHSYYPKVRLYVNFKYKYSFQKIDGTPSNPKSDKMAIYFAYCPFCGKEYPK